MQLKETLADGTLKKKETRYELARRKHEKPNQIGMTKFPD
jgi:hypothetical protein